MAEFCTPAGIYGSSVMRWLYRSKLMYLINFDPIFPFLKLILGQVCSKKFQGCFFQVGKFFGYDECYFFELWKRFYVQLCVSCGCNVKRKGFLTPFCIKLDRSTIFYIYFKSVWGRSREQRAERWHAISLYELVRYVLKACVVSFRKRERGGKYVLRFCLIL